MYELFDFGELKPTSIILQLVDRSVKVPRGMIENVLVQVDEFYFSVDFLVLDIESSGNLSQISIILGRPFLAITNACINCRTGVMNVSFGNKKLRLNVFNAALGPPINDYGEINMLEKLVEETEPTVLSQDHLQACLSHFDVDNFDIDIYGDETAQDDYSGEQGGDSYKYEEGSNHPSNGQGTFENSVRDSFTSAKPTHDSSQSKLEKVERVRASRPLLTTTAMAAQIT